MFRLADGTGKEIERGQGGMPSKSDLMKAQAFVRRHLAEQAKQRRAALAEASRRAERRRELLFSGFSKDDPRLKKLKQERQAARKTHKRPKLNIPKAARIEPRIESNFAVMVPPWYWWPSVSCEGAHAETDNANGSCYLQVESYGAGYCEAYALFTTAVSFSEDNPMQRVAALVYYADSWFDYADFYTGNNDMRTTIYVWSRGEVQAWADLNPSWSDGVGWLEEHGPYPNGEEGTISAETYFPLVANEWYYVQIVFHASVYADSGWAGGAWSGLYFGCTVPMVTFGSLF